MKRMAALVLFAIVFFVVPGVVQSGSISISDGVNTQIIPTDAAGIATFSLPLGNWTTNNVIGASYPALGTANNADMDLNSLDISKNSANALTIMFSDVNFQGSGSVTALIGGTLSNTFTLTYSTYYSSTNTLFALTNLLTTQTFSNGSFNGTLYSSIASGSPYSLTQVVTINKGSTTHNSVSFNAELETETVPEPSLILLLGIGVMGISGCWRKFAK
jgi:hypothetical protein